MADDTSANQMKFLFASLVQGLSWGGSEELWCRTARTLARNGHGVTVSVEGVDPLPEEITSLAESGVLLQYRLLPAASLAKRAWRRLRKLPADHDQLERYRKRMNAVKPDLVCFSNGSILEDPGYLEITAAAAIPFVNVSQANAEEWWPNDARAERAARALESAECCFFVSEANRRLWALQTAREPPRSEIVRNPFKVSYDNKPLWPEMTDTLRLACVARLDPRAKGQDLLFQVLSLPKWKKRKLSVSLVGQGRMEATLRRLASYLDIEDRIEFRGQVDDIESVWAEHHALVLPSRYEGLPLALVEAMLSGRPAIVTNVAGNAEAVEHGKTGFLAAAATMEHFDTALDEAWNRRAEWPGMGLAAARRIRELVPRDPAAEFARRLVGIAEQARIRRRGL